MQFHVQQFYPTNLEFNTRRIHNHRPQSLRTFGWLYLLLAIALNLAVVAEAKAQPGDLVRMKESTVRLFDLDQSKICGTGSGFLVGNGQHVVTNYHVIETCALSSGRVIVALGINTSNDIENIEAREVIWSDSEKDLAILELESALSRPPVEINPVDYVGEGGRVIAIGFPGDADFGEYPNESWFIHTTTHGEVQRFFRDPTGRRLIQHGATTNPGNSGGPLFNHCGQVIGVNTLKSPRGGIFWSVAIDEILPVLRRHGIPTTTINRTCVADGGSNDEHLRAELDRLRAELDRLQNQEPQAGGAALQPADSLASAVEQYQREIERIEASISNPLRDYLPIASLLIAVAAVVVAFTKRGRVVVKEAAQTVGRVASKSVDWATGAASRSSPRIRGVEGVHAEREFAFKEGASLRFGRDPAFAGEGVCFSPSTEGVSKRHCTLTFDERQAKFMLEDHYSTFGTFVNDGQKVEPGISHPLYPGDRFYLGYPDNQFRVQL